MFLIVQSEQWTAYLDQGTNYKYIVAEHKITKQTYAGTEQSTIMFNVQQ